METTTARLLDWYPLTSELWSLLHPRGLLSGAKPGVTLEHFTQNPQAFYIRKDNGEPSTVVNVFDTDGNKAYTIERLSRNSTTWTIYKANSRTQVARVSCGIFNRAISFLEKPNLHSRQIGQPRWLYGGLPGRKFYLNDGAPYEWGRSSQFLERIINPGGAHEEVRQRLARMCLLRPWRFDWELLVDPDFDAEIALATGFISLLTEWSTTRRVIPGTRAAIAPAE